MILKLLTALAVAYLGWRAWHGWGRLAGTPKPAPRPAPRAFDADAADARAVLGVSATADAAEIRAAHRRLVADAHPDRPGGSAERTGRLNAARDLLLGRGDMPH